ncbi:two-component sensor protein [Actinobacillus equuli]|nr:two-component sensor protein [Actinobacillus equuli]
MLKFISQFFSKIMLVRNYLAYQLFAYFGLTFATLLAITLALPNFDARSFSPIETEERIFFEQETKSTELQYNLDEIFERKLFVSTANGFDVILLDRKSGILLGLIRIKLLHSKYFYIERKYYRTVTTSLWKFRNLRSVFC